MANQDRWGESDVHTAEVLHARTLLFVPGDRPERFAKAVASGADCVVLDLEDAVDPADKERARHCVDEWFANGGRGLARVNAFGTAWHQEDVEMVLRHDRVMMLPKAEDPVVLDGIHAMEPRATFIPLIETARGVVSAREVLGSAGVIRPAFGSIDLAAELGVSHTDDDALAVARGTLVLASAAAGVGAPIDGVTTAIRDQRVLEADVLRAKRIGMTAKLCVHPDQVAPTHRVFAATSDEIAWAERVVAAADGKGAIAVDGHMVDAPVLLRARAILSHDDVS